MTDPSQRQIDSDIDKSIDLFQRADVGIAKIVMGRSPKRILLVLDGSSQDDAVIHLAKQLHRRLECELAFHPATSDDFQIDEKNFAVLESLRAKHVEIPQVFENDYDRILAAVEESKPDLLIAPCPFGRDFVSLGDASTGTVIDVLAARVKIPFIAIRRPDATGRDPTTHLRVILTSENSAAELAARWAVGLLRRSGRLELLLLVERSYYENFRSTMASLQPGVEVSSEDLENALAKNYAKLHAGLQEAARAIGFTYELLVRYEADEKPITPEHPKTHPALMVLALERSDHDSQGEVHDFIRRSPHPVLVVSAG